jgi:hypothetical protein
MAFSSEGSFTWHTCCDKGVLFIQCYLNDQHTCPIIRFEHAAQGSSDHYATALTTVLHVKSFPYCGITQPPTPPGIKTLSNLLFIMSEWFQVNLSFSGPVALEMKIFKILPYISTRQNSPIVTPTWPPRAMIFTDLILYYFRKLSYKFEFFWPSGSWKDFYKYVSFINTWKTVSPIVAPPDPWGRWFSKNWFCAISKSFHIIFSGPVVLY